MIHNGSSASDANTLAITPEHQAALDRIVVQDRTIALLEAKVAERDQTIAALEAKFANHGQENAALRAKVIELKGSLATIKRVAFGPSSERRCDDSPEAEQGQLLFDTKEEAENHDAEEKRKAEERREAKEAREAEKKRKAQEAKASGKKKTKNHGKRIKPRPRARFSHLMRERETIEPTPPHCPAGFKLVKIGEATSERLCYIPAVLYVREVTYPKYVLVRISDAEAATADGVVDVVDGAVASQAGEDDGSCSGEDICGMDVAGCAADVSDLPAKMQNGDGGDGAPRRPRRPRRTVYQGKVEGHIVDGGIPDESLLAQIAVSKYCDGIPLFRQVGIFARSDVDLSRQTMANWMRIVAIEIEPLAKRIMQLIVSRDRIFADETRLPTLKPGKGKTATGYLWVFGVDETSHGGTYPRLASFIFDPSRGEKCPQRELQSFVGKLQVDGYGVYEAIAKARNSVIEAEIKSMGLSDAEYKKAYEEAKVRRGIRIVNCWSHARRYVLDAHREAPSDVTKRTLDLMKDLWEIEREVRYQSPETRIETRTKKSAPAVKELFDLLERVRPVIPQVGKLYRAIEYIMKRREGLEYFLRDGTVDMDSNFIERTIRPQTIVRKNSLFAGSESGGASWAILATVLETAELNNVDPHAWLEQTLRRLANGWSSQRIDELLPFNFRPDEAPRRPHPALEKKFRKDIADAGSQAGEQASSPCRQAA